MTHLCETEFKQLCRETSPSSAVTVQFSPHAVDRYHCSLRLRGGRCNALHCIDGLVQDCSISIANALEILQSCTKASVWNTKLILGLRSANERRRYK